MQYVVQHYRHCAKCTTTFGIAIQNKVEIVQAEEEPLLCYYQFNDAEESAIFRKVKGVSVPWYIVILGATITAIYFHVLDI